jgi:hypothetical protein
MDITAGAKKLTPSTWEERRGEAVRVWIVPDGDPAQ